MAPRVDRRAADRMAGEMAASIGREALLLRTNLGLTVRTAARLAGVAPSTYQRVEDGDGAVQLDTLCRVAASVGLKVWAKAFPVRHPSLRDTGQLRLAEHIRSLVPASQRVAIELALGNQRSIDLAVFGPLEIIAIEIERIIGDFQAQHRAAAAKRDELAASHRRPVRLVVVLQDTRRNRAAVREHEPLIRSALPAGSRQILLALRTGRPLGRDGLLWLRSPPPA
jgi:transcriptional regulator with XRE-family HTH domain